MANNHRAAQYRRRMTRAWEKPLLYGVMLFQLAALALLSFKYDAFSAECMILAVLLPAFTYLALKLTARLFPVDRAIYILAMFLISVGVVTLRCIYNPIEKPLRQARYIPLSFFAMLFGICYVRFSRKWEQFAWLPAIPAVCLLLTTYVLRSSSDSAHNWAHIGGMQFQPSEFVKPMLIVLLAAGFANQYRWGRIVRCVLFAALLCGILVVQRDLGAMLQYFLLTVAMFYVATGNIWLTMGTLGIAGAGGFAFLKLLPKIPAFAYLANRIEIWIDPWNSTQASAHQIVQGLISIASGGIFGAGAGLGSPSKVAVVDSDYIFAAVSEDFGMVFALCVLAVYLILVLRGMSVAMNAKSRYHTLIAFGASFLLAAQVVIIVCGNLHLIPLTGITLPLISKGLSSQVSVMATIGLLLGVSSVNAQDEYDEWKRIERLERGDAP